MFTEDDGVYYASNPETFGLGSTINVKPDFLARGVKMRAPEVVEILHVFTGSVPAVTGGALGRDAAKLIKKAIFTDDEEWCNLSGASIRVLDQMDFGDKSVDPADVASAATSASYVAVFRQTFTPPRMKRPRDYAIPLINFLEGNSMQIQFCSALPDGWGAGGGAIGALALSYRMWARVVEGRKNEVKSRRKLSEQSFNRDDDWYPTDDGAIRALVLSSVLTSTGYTSMAGVTVLNSNSPDLFFPDFPSYLARDRYRRMSDSLDTTNDEFIRSTPTAIPLITPDRDQKYGSMPQFKSVHLKIGSTPASAVLIKDTLVPRPLRITAKQMGFASTGEYQNAVINHGYAVTAEGSKGRPVREWNERLARISPLRIEGREDIGAFS